MKFDWTISIGTILLLIGMVSSITAAYYSLRNNFEKQISGLKDEFKLQFDEIGKQFGEVGIQLTKLLEGDVRELRARIVILESGQSEWIRTIRERTHTLANEQQAMFLRIDRLERPGGNN